MASKIKVWLPEPTYTRSQLLAQNHDDEEGCYETDLLVYTDGEVVVRVGGYAICEGIDECGNVKWQEDEEWPSDGDIDIDIAASEDAPTLPPDYEIELSEDCADDLAECAWQVLKACWPEHNGENLYEWPLRCLVKDSTPKDLVGLRVTEEWVRDRLWELDDDDKNPVITPGGRLTGEIRLATPDDQMAVWEDEYLTRAGANGDYICTGQPGSIWDVDVQYDMADNDEGWPLISGQLNRGGVFGYAYTGRRGFGEDLVTIDTENEEVVDFEGNDPGNADAILL